MKKLLMSTALMTVLFSGAALSAAHEKSGIKIGGTLETTINTLTQSTPGKSENTGPAVIGYDAALNISTSKDLSNGLKMSAGFSIDSSDNATASVAGAARSADSSVSNQFITLAAGSTSFSIGEDVMGVIDVVRPSNFTPHVAQPFRLSGVGGTIGALTTSHSQNGFFLEHKTDMLTFQGVYSPTTAADKDTQASVNNEISGSGYDLAVKGSLGIPGLTVGYGVSEQTANVSTGAKKAESKTYGISYAVAGFTVGYGRSENDVTAATGDTKNTSYGISYQVNKQLSVSAAMGKSDQDNLVNDQDYQTLQVGYDFGGMGVTFGYYEAENLGGVSGTDNEVFEIRTVTRF